MKTVKILFAFAAISLLISGTAQAVTIVGTSHDLLTGTGPTATLPAGPGSADLCRFCHAPHVGATQTALWDRNNAGTYTKYDSLTLATANRAGAVTLGTESLACLSCHDGVTGYENINAATTPANTTVMNNTNGFLIGESLSNDHPVGVTTTAARTQTPDEIKADNAITGALLTLYGGGNDTVECASCHKVHDNEFGSFLRLANTADLCQTCHTK